jgi:hypothetical protein
MQACGSLGQNRTAISLARITNRGSGKTVDETRDRGRGAVAIERQRRPHLLGVSNTSRYAKITNLPNEDADQTSTRLQLGCLVPEFGGAGFV